MVGSSRNSTCGRWSSAAASSHFMRSPSESWRVGCFDQVAELEQLGQLAQRLVELGARDVVDRAVHREGLGGRQVPEELLLLPHDQRDRLQEARSRCRGT